MKLYNLHEMDSRMRELERRASEGDAEAAAALHQARLRATSGPEHDYEIVRLKSEKELRHYLSWWKDFSDEERAQQWAQFANGLHVRTLRVLLNTLGGSVDAQMSDVDGLLRRRDDYFVRTPSVADIMVAKYGGFTVAENFHNTAKNNMIPVGELPKFSDFEKMTERMRGFTLENLVSLVGRYYSEQ